MGIDSVYIDFTIDKDKGTSRTNTILYQLTINYVSISTSALGKRLVKEDKKLSRQKSIRKNTLDKI